MKTVSFRMTLLFVVMFSFALATVFILVHIALSHILTKSLDEDLRLEAHELKVLYDIGGIEGLKDILIAESIAEGTENAFYVFLSPDMEVLATTDTSSFQHIFKNGYIPPELSGNVPAGEGRLLTVHNEPHRDQIRILIKAFDDGTVLEIGESMREERQVLTTTRKIFSVSSLCILLVGTVLFWRIMSGTMKGVTQITKTASEIGRDDLVSRVPQSDKGTEIDDLAESFNRMLERIAVLIGEMQDITNNVAHYLRTPITRIRGTAEAAYFNGDDPIVLKDAIGTIIQECDRLTMMIQVMLEIATIESETRTDSDGSVDVATIVEEIVDLFQPVAENSNITIEQVLSESKPAIEGNAVLLSGAVANLVDNAVKYTPPDGNVVVGATVVNGMVEISVSDTGGGISDDDIPHIFDKFYRGGQAGKTLGNGLGLSYVQAVARRYGGRVRIDTTGSAGTTFTLVFPAVQEHRQ